MQASPIGGYGRGTLAIAGAVIALGAPSPAQALHGTQPRGRAGCIDARGVEGCTRGAALGEDSNLGPLSVSPNGRFVYAVDRPINGTTARNLGRLLIFSRDPQSGTLRELPGRRGCLRNSLTPVKTQHGPCRRVGGIENPEELVVSPNGRRLYAATSGELGSYLTTFAIDPRTGEARRLQCLTNVVQSSCTTVPLQSANTLIISPDSRYVTLGLESEVATGAAPLIRVYRVDGHGLAPAQCLADAPIHGLACTIAPLLGNASVDGLAPSPDGRYVYASAFERVGAERILTFARDLHSGRLSPLPAAGDCVSDEAPPPAPCVAVPITGPDLTMSSGGGTLFAATEKIGEESERFAVAALTRDAASGALSERPGAGGCAAWATVPGCGALPAWTNGAWLPAVSPAPGILLASFDEELSNDGIMQVVPAPGTGALTATDIRGCVPEGCPPIRGIQGGTSWLALSADGRSMYLASGSGIATIRVKP